MLLDDLDLSDPLLLHECEQEPTYTLYRVGADLGGESVLLKTEGGSALFDVGYAWCVPKTLKNVQAALGPVPAPSGPAGPAPAPDLLLFTHSHYDHVAGAGYLRRHFPDMTVCASEHAAHVLQRPGAIKTMRRLNAAEAQARGLDRFEDVPDDFQIDRILRPGQTIAVGSLRFTVLEAHGHTRDSLAFWCEEAGLLVSCESGGVCMGPLPTVGRGSLTTVEGAPIPEKVKYRCELPALTGYGDCLDYLARARALNPQVMVAPHYGALVGAEVADYFVSMDFWARYQVDLVKSLHERGFPPEQIQEAFKREFYQGSARVFQPEPAFDLNAGFTVSLIIEEYC